MCRTRRRYLALWNISNYTIVQLIAEKRKYKMKRILYVMVIIVLFNINIPLAESKISKIKIHNQWKSFITTGSSLTSVRMFSTNYEHGDSLSIDFLPGYCNNGILQIISMGNEKDTYSEEVTLYGSLRVDKKDTQNVKYTMYTEGGFICTKIETINGSKLLKDSMTGQTIRFKIKGHYGDIYRKFSLMGFSSAYQRAQDLCLSMEKYNSDADFFKEDTSSNEEYIPDATYF